MARHLSPRMPGLVCLVCCWEGGAGCFRGLPSSLLWATAPLGTCTAVTWPGPGLGAAPDAAAQSLCELHFLPPPPTSCPHISPKGLAAGLSTSAGNIKSLKHSSQ